MQREKVSARSTAQPPVLWRTHVGAISPTRPRFARSRVLPPSSRPLQINSAAFRIEVRGRGSEKCARTWRGRRVDRSAQSHPHTSNAASTTCDIVCLVKPSAL
jgi:hypothetical protein